MKMTDTRRIYSLIQISVNGAGVLLTATARNMLGVRNRKDRQENP
jgi:hypothetical protein